ncbi:MAG: DUF3857 domain-containing protein [Sphingomonadales bacterium]|nr:DUF3857 domain-containing protein [Sphingomonadales bacterium]
MKTTSSLLALTLALSLPFSPALAESAATAAPNATIAAEAAPAWVSQRTIPDATPARLQHAEGGVAYLLSDYQVRLGATGHESWFRVATRVVDRSGLEDAGQIAITWDPRIETPAVAFIHLIRDGKVIDLTPETRFRVVERESDLAEGIISGSLRAIANLRDVRVGDVIDYATVTHTTTRLWPGHLFESFTQRFSQPVGLRAVRYLAPAGTPLQWKPRNSTVAFATRKLGSEQEWEWSATDPAMLEGEKDLPAWHPQWGSVDVSTMKSWAEVAQWATTLYAGDESLPADFAAKLDAIAAKYPAPADRLTEATRLVQDSIRYVGEEMGEGSYVPRRPKTVLERGYGDCKDKALLLALALRRLGIDAAPALVSTLPGFDLPDRLPSPLVFDHVIVRAVLADKVLWLDATGTHRGGRGGAIVSSDLGHALPIRPGQTALEAMTGYADHSGEMAVTERFTVDDNAAKDTGALTLRVETRYTDALADWFRARVAVKSARVVAQDNTDFYRKRFAGLAEAKPLELTDDRDGNVLTMVENYTLAKADFDKDKTFQKLSTNAYAVDDFLPARQPTPRREPLALPAFVHRHQIIEIHAADRRIGTIDDIDSKADGMAFTRKATHLPDGGIRLDYRFETGATRVAAAAEAEAIYALQKTVNEESALDFDLTRSARLSDTQGSIDPELLAPYRADFDKVVDLTKKEDQASQIEALSLISGIAEKLPRPSPVAGLVDGMKGAILAQLQRPGPALAALRSATTQYTGNADFFRLRIAFEIDAGDVPAIIAALRAAQKAQAPVVTALREDWVRYIYQKLRPLGPADRDTASQDLCTVLVDAGWQQAPRTRWGNQLLGCAIATHVRRAELPQARALLAKEPSAGSLISLSIDRRNEAIWPDIEKLAADGFRKALDREVANASTAMKAAPKDYPAVTRTLAALRAAGRAAEAVTLGKAYASDIKAIEAVGDNGFWLVNEYASSLADSGHLDDAIAAFDAVLKLGVDNYPSLINLAINRAGALASAGRHAEAVAALQEIDTKQQRGTSPYGRMFVWANMACSHRALGHAAEADALDAKLAEKPSDNWSAAASAAACRGDSAAIAKMLVTRLAEPESREAALALFIRFTGPIVLPAFDQRLRAVRQAALADPAVQAEFRKYGRAVTVAGTSAGWQDF